MSKNKLQIVDFSLFADSIRILSRITEGAKLIFKPTGLEVYCAHGMTARCEMITNSVKSEDEISFCVDSVANFSKILNTVKEVHAGDFSGLEFSYDCPQIKFSSKKFKTKCKTCQEDIIQQCISKKITTEMQSVFDFTVSPDLIKRLNGHSFMFSNSKDIRIYIETKDDMENNVVYATMGNRENDLNNEITLKLGLVTAGSIPDGRRIILDLDGINLLNSTGSNEIKTSLMNYNVLLSNTKFYGGNGSFLDVNIYSGLLNN